MSKPDKKRDHAPTVSEPFDSTATPLLDHLRLGDRPGRRAESPTFAPGERVADRYVVMRLLGTGGMGEVYEAQDDELSIPVALKALRLDLARDRRSLWSLKREVLMARAVAHPHVCRVYDLGRHGEEGSAVWFLSMELLRGETLRARLRRQGRLPAAVALPWVEQMVAGLGAAHQAGVMHLDFKSGNVMLVGETGDGERAVVTDFGLARTVRIEEAEEEKWTALVGTLAYMAPEQLRGEEVGPAADIYALGVVLYEMVTGRLPFEGKTPLESAVRRLGEDAPSPRSVVAEVDERWDEVILRCLSREPGGRFGRVEEVVEALLGRVSVAPGLPGMLSRVRHTLPAERDSFVSREAELEELEGRFGSGSRLVTLAGAGGMGKTRLAVRYGWQSLSNWSGGVWFCDLTEARTVSGIVSAVAKSLGVPLGKGDPVEQLGHAIAGRGLCLVILDNFEQVARHAGETVGRWLERAPEGRFVVTSRALLNVPGEEVQEVEPLGLTSGVELFVTRAQRLQPRFEPQESDAKVTEEVVRLAEGMPLAIELAAARMRMMTVGQLAERMQERFRLLGGAGSGRHASLRAAIDGSWELMREWEKAAWAQCAVFEGGFTLEAAEGVVNLEMWPEAPWVVDVVQSLVDKSLLRAWVPEIAPGGGMPEARFGMYVSLQEYARMKLGEEGAIASGGSGMQAERAAEERHGKWYARYGTEGPIEALVRDGAVERRRRLERELENLLTACRRAVRRGDGETSSATYQASWAVLELRGPFGAAVELGREVLGCPRLGGEETAKVIWTLGLAERLSGRMDEARAHCEAALAIHRDAGNRRFEGVVLGTLSNIHREQGRMEEARAQCEAALAIHRAVGNRDSEGVVLGYLGNVHREQGRIEEARAQYEAALAIHREMGNRRLEGFVIGNLGTLDHEQMRMEEARGNYEAALIIAREVRDRRLEGIVLGNLAILHQDQGRMEEARAQYEAVLAIHREVGDRRVEGIVLGHLGNLHRDQGRMDEACGHYETAIAIHREVGDRRSEGSVLGSLGNLLHHQGRIDEARDALTKGEAILRQIGEPTELGKLLCARAELEHGSGNGAAARTTLGEAEALAIQVGSGPDSELGRMLAKLRQALPVNA